MSISVRAAQPHDLEWILGQLRKFSKFFGTKMSLYGDEEFASQGMLNMMNHHLVLIADKEGMGPVGLIAGVITPHMFNPNIRVLSETFWWVDESHRLSKAGILLLNAFTEYGKKNSDWITFALEEHSPVKDKSLLKRGFHLQERSFLMEVSN